MAVTVVGCTVTSYKSMTYKRFGLYFLFSYRKYGAKRTRLSSGGRSVLVAGVVLGKPVTERHRLCSRSVEVVE